MILPDPPTISIIIPTYNRSASLSSAILSIAEQSYDKSQYEIVVVDNGSTDDTASVVQNLITNGVHPSIRYVYEGEPGLLSGRHRGVIEARGEILTFTDDDVDADRSWLEAIARAFQDARIILVGGRSLPRYETTPPDWVEYQWADTPYGRYLTYLSLLDLGDEPREIDPIFVFGLNYSIRKQALLELKGFNPDCVPDHLLAFLGDGETGLSIKARAAGFRAWYDPHVLVYHRIPAHRLTTAYFEKRAFGQGVSDSYTLLRRRGGRLRFNDRAKLTKLVLAQTVDGALLRCLQLCRGETKTSLRNRLRVAYRDGFRFHTSQALQSGALMEWVTRDDYLSDYRLPQTRGVPAGS